MSHSLGLARDMGDLRAVSTEAGNLSDVERQLGAVRRAEELAQLALATYRRVGDVWMVPNCLNALAAFAADRGDDERSAQLRAAAERQVEEQQAKWPPDEKPLFAQTRARLTETVTSVHPSRAWESCRAMSLDQAIAYSTTAR